MESLTEDKLRSMIREELLTELEEVGEEMFSRVVVGREIVGAEFEKDEGEASLMFGDESSRDRQMEFVIQANGDGSLSLKIPES